MRKNKPLSYAFLTFGSLLVGALAYRFLDKRVAYAFEFLPIGAKRKITLFSKLSAPEFVLSVGAALALRGAYLHRTEQKPLQTLMPYAYVPVTLFLAWLVKRNLKYVVSRKRPLLLFVNKDFGFEFKVSDESTEQSFPSGHSALIFSLAHAANRSELMHPAIGYSIATILSLSRAPLNKHYLSDLIGGAFLGLIIPEIVLDLLEQTDLPRPRLQE